MILFLVLLSALKDSKRREETRAIKTMLRVPGRGYRANEEGIKRRQPQISTQNPISVALGKPPPFPCSGGDLALV